MAKIAKRLKEAVNNSAKDVEIMLPQFLMSITAVFVAAMHWNDPDEYNPLKIVQTLACLRDDCIMDYGGWYLQISGFINWFLNQEESWSEEGMAEWNEFSFITKKWNEYVEIMQKEE